MSLVHAQVFHRHGGRTPETHFSPPADWSGTTDPSAKAAAGLARRVPLIGPDGAPLSFDALRADGQLLAGDSRPARDARLYSESHTVPHYNVPPH